MLKRCLLILCIALPVAARAELTEVTVTLPSGTSVVSQRYAAGGDALVLWMTGQFGQIEAEHKAAAYLAERGIEVWITDWLAPYFLPHLPSSIGQVPEDDLSAWLEALRQHQPGRQIVLVASGHATAWPLRAVRAWQQARIGSGEPVAGALLMWPLLYRDLEPAQEPEYDPVVGTSRLNLLILQPQSSAGYWWRERLKAALEAGGSRVQVQVLPGLRDGFYRRADANAREQAEGARLGEILAPALHSLLKAPAP